MKSKNEKVILFFPKMEEKDVILLPASVLMVAASLIEAGYQVKIIDQRVNENWGKELVKELSDRPLAFGVSALTGKQILNGLEASQMVKGNSQVPVVWGGVHPSLLPNQTLKNKNIDFVVVGEGEDTFLELVKTLDLSKSDFDKHGEVQLQNIKGMAYKNKDEILINPRREFINIEESPKIPYQLVDIEKYIDKKSFATGEKGRDIALYTSRGCPHRCGFCYNNEFNKRRWRGKTVETVVREMGELINKYKITSFSIEDDEFFADAERARGICELILKRNIKVDIFTTCRVNYVFNSMNDDYLNLLYRAGFKTLAFGVESGSDKILQLANKDITIEQVYETIKRLKKAGINSKYYFMAGFPTETVDDLYKTTDVIRKMKKLDPQIRIPAWRFFTPYPGTDLYHLSIKEGWVPPKNLEEWAGYDFNTIRMPWVRGKKKRIVNNVAFLIDYLEMGGTAGSGLFFRVAKIFGKIVDWRWQNHYFSFVPEKWLIKSLLKIKKTIFS